ncbi:MAG: signal recognition particle-docking protein FtsY, partial [Candidatus Poribacteria bacterium]|nr:signal recognition particle-docking protein FtsY [Candidatus Poribacteria bacterium]
AAEPPQKRGFFQRLKDGLTKTRQALTSQLTGLLRFGRKIDEELYDELEELLIRSDVGVQTTLTLLDRVREEARKRGLNDASQLHDVLKKEILHIMDGEPTPLDVSGASPFVLLVVGVNGVGKTTTIGKLASRFRSEGKKVLVAAGDTFRAAAIEQLEIWCERAKVDMIRQAEGSDPASVVFDAVQAAKSRGVDLLIVDTAGRLHNKKNLMNELAKIGRVAGREIEGAPHEVLLVLDGTTGQNAVRQAQEFNEIVNVTGIALTKLDGTAKGGIVIAVKNELNIPVKLIGIGESIEDLRDFSPRDFVEALFAREEDDAA